MSDAGGIDPVQPSDASLIIATRAGDRDAYAMLYERHVDAVKALARYLARDDAEAEDLVAETFARVLAVLRRGAGPHLAFRPYLHTALRRIKYDRARGERRQVTSGQLEEFDPGVPFVDPALEGLERSLVARAFLSLPERWQVVLWHTEVEGANPRDIAPMMGLNAGGVAALAYRAREGLRKAYLQMHLPGTPGGSAAACRPVLDKLGAYVRRGLSRRNNAAVETHLHSCSECTAVCAELADVNRGLRTVVGPLILGTATGGYLARVGAGAAGVSGTLGLFRNVPKAQQATTVGVVLAILLAGLSWTLAAQEHPPAGQSPPVAASPGAKPPVFSGRQAPPSSPRRQPSAPPPAQARTIAWRSVPVATPPPNHRPPAAAKPRPSSTPEPTGALLPGELGITLRTVDNVGRGAVEEVGALVNAPPDVLVPLSRDLAGVVERHSTPSTRSSLSHKPR